MAGRRLTWRERLDDRVDQCPGCDGWRWDRHCNKCDRKKANDERKGD